MKHCISCQLTKSLDAFYKNGKYTYCKECTLSENRSRREAFKVLCVTYKGGSCSKCGYNKCMAALEFHHQQDKKFTLSHYKGYNFNDKIKVELDKCILLCANCHREEHYEESTRANSYRVTQQHMIKPKNYCTCGKQIARQSKKCRACTKTIAKRKKINWPEVAELQKMLESLPFTAVAKQLGVSDNAIRKYLSRQ